MWTSILSDASKSSYVLLEYTTLSVHMAPFLSFLGNKRITEEPAALMLDLQAPLEETDGVAEALQTLLSKVRAKNIPNFDF